MRTKPLIQPLESRQLLTATLAITTVTSSAATVTTASSFTAAISMSNTGSDPGTAAVAAELFLVPQGSTLNATSNTHVLYSFKPIYAGSTRTLSKSIVTKSIAPGTYILTACPFNTTTQLADITKPITGPLVTIVSPPVAGDLAATLATSAASYKAGSTLTANLTLTNKSTLTTDVPVTFYLSTDKTLSAKDILLSSQSFGTTLTANKATTATRTMTLPKNHKGTFYLIAQINNRNTNPALPAKVLAVTTSAITIT